MENSQTRFIVTHVPTSKIYPGEIPMSVSIEDLLAYWCRYPMTKKELHIFLSRVEQIVNPQLSELMPLTTLEKMSMLVRFLDYNYQKSHTGKLPTQLNSARKACERSIRSWIDLYPNQSAGIEPLIQLSLTQETRQLALNKYWGIPSYSQKNHWYFCLNIF